MNENQIASKSRLKEEFFIKGSPISEGIAIGHPFFIDNNFEERPPELPISVGDIENEIARYRTALQSSQKEMEALKAYMLKQQAWEGVAILDCHLQILKDPYITTAIEQQIRQNQKNIEFIFHNALKEYQALFSKLHDDFFKERFKDIQDVAKRIMRHLGTQKRHFSIELSPNSILFAREIVPSDTTEIYLQNIQGFVTEVGGETSHVSIMARAQGIPYVANVNLAGLDYQSIKTVVVDGESGIIVFNPSSETLKNYQEKKSRFVSYLRKLETEAILESETIDGYKVCLSANLELEGECSMLHEYGSDGIGLFRSESLYLSQNDFPSEEQQFLVYKRMIEGMKGLPVVIRTFDIGGDKKGSYHQLKNENNPYLGCRAIRFLLKEKEIFKSQLRAILRASIFGDVSILFPMVSGVDELRAAKNIVAEVSEELSEKGYPFNSKIRLGCMVEVPSAALTCDILAQESDFLSIGTNDLIQYSLAVDRGNQAVSYLYNPVHPSIIRLIKIVVSEGERYGKPVTICGEMAADPKLTALLLGLGIKELSVTSRCLPCIKRSIRQTYLVDAYYLAEEASLMKTAQEIEEFLKADYEKKILQNRPIPVSY